MYSTIRELYGLIYSGSEEEKKINDQFHEEIGRRIEGMKDIQEFDELAGRVYEACSVGAEAGFIGGFCFAIRLMNEVAG